MTTALQYRQGDVFFQKRDVMPEGAEPVQVNGRLVVKHGTATGHSHGFNSGAKLFKLGERMILEVEEGAELTHDEHSTIVFEKGIYDVVEQREWLPSEFRTVMD